MGLGHSIGEKGRDLAVEEYRLPVPDESLFESRRTVPLPRLSHGFIQFIVYEMSLPHHLALLPSFLCVAPSVPSPWPGLPPSGQRGNCMWVELIWAELGFRVWTWRLFSPFLTAFKSWLSSLWALGWGG